MKTTTWTTIGSEAELRIAQFRVQSDDPTMTYHAAKEDALLRLRSHIAPYLERIHELETDLFMLRGQLPQLKAWSYGPYFVIARTKKRAAELTGKSRHSFNSCFSEEDGDWWYEYAGEEGLWREDEFGVYRRTLGRELATSLLNAAMEPYLSMPLSKLQQLVRQNVSSEGVSVHGTPYTVEIQIGHVSWGEPCVSIFGSIQDGLDWINRVNRFETRTLLIASDSASDWRKEGF